ncbi:MAG: carotenoid biosynthesis protein [Rhodothermales bacterium]|nr:carotenoid biosynthesis protein [Rhodothermales bacterium]
MRELNRERDIEPTSKWLNRVQWVFIGSIVFSLAGSLFLRLFPATGQFFGPYYETLVKAPTWTYMSLLPLIPILMYRRQLGARTLGILFGIGAIIGGLSEFIGTTTGYPFGTYAYTAWLGPKLAGHVPYFIPLSWFAMSVVSFDLAGRIARTATSQILLGAAFMVLWDVSLDPAMSRAFPFWYYPDGGFFYGMPLINWFGWYVVSIVIMSGYAITLGGTRLIHSNAGLFYALNCAFPLMLSLIYGLEGAFVIGVVATTVPFILSSLRKRNPVLERAAQ